jgi:hypothetical protein
MSCFRELFARYPDKVMELCTEEAADARRPYCHIFDWPQTPDPCVLCDRPAFDDGEPIGWHEGKRVCDSAECHRLWFWIRAPGKDGGNKRRQALKQHFGTRSIFDIPHGVRREAILTAMLTHEAQEKANGGKPRQRVVA